MMDGNPPGIFIILEENKKESESEKSLGLGLCR
jgi:hypothetical protein